MDKFLDPTFKLFIKTSNKFTGLEWDSDEKQDQSDIIRWYVFERILDHLEAKLHSKLENTLFLSKYSLRTIIATIHPLPSTTRFTSISIPTRSDLPPTQKDVAIEHEHEHEHEQEQTFLPPLSSIHPKPTNPYSSWEAVRSIFKELPAELPTKNHIRKIAVLPARNPLRPNPHNLHFRKGGQYNLSRPSNLKAALLQVAGQSQHRGKQCKNCQEGKGPWELCVSSPPALDDIHGACANCSYNGKSTTCNFYKQQGKYSYLIYLIFS